MLNLKTNTKIVFGIYFFLYAVAYGISVIDIRSDLSSAFCGILTAGISIGAYYMMIKAILLAFKIEQAPHWHIACCCRSSAIQVVVCFGIYMFLLGTLKLWAIGDLFIHHWQELPISYSAQAWAFLAQNATGILLTWVTLEIFENKYTCAQKARKYIPCEGEDVK